MRLLGIDFGLTHVGLAVGEKMPREYGTIDAKNLGELLSKISIICREEKIDKIIVGLPKSNLPKVKSKALIATDNFIEALKAHINLPVETVDEAYSSVEAEMILSDEGVDWRKAKTKIHALSAVLILNQYISKNA